MNSVRRFKKIFLFLSLILIISTNLFAQSKFDGFTGKGLRILVDESTIKNGSGSDSWIAEKLKSDFVNDLVSFSEIEVINSGDKQKILELQRESESETYGESVVEIGKRI